MSASCAPIRTTVIREIRFFAALLFAGGWTSAGHDRIPWLGSHWARSIQVAALPKMFYTTNGIRLVNLLGISADSRTLGDSFGSYFALRNALNGHLSSFGTSLLLIPEGELEPRTPHVREREPVLSRASALLCAMADDAGTRSLTQLSAMAGARLSLPQKANDLFFRKTLRHVQSPSCGGLNSKLTRHSNPG